MESGKPLRNLPFWFSIALLVIGTMVNLYAHSFPKFVDPAWAENVYPNSVTYNYDYIKHDQSLVDSLYLLWTDARERNLTSYWILKKIGNDCLFFGFTLLIIVMFHGELSRNSFMTESKTSSRLWVFAAATSPLIFMMCGFLISDAFEKEQMYMPPWYDEGPSPVGIAIILSIFVGFPIWGLISFLALLGSAFPSRLLRLPVLSRNVFTNVLFLIGFPVLSYVLVYLCFVDGGYAFIPSTLLAIYSLLVFRSGCLPMEPISD